MDDLKGIFKSIVNEKITRTKVDKIISDFNNYDRADLFKILIDYENYLINNSNYYNEYIYVNKQGDPASRYLPLYYGFFIDSFKPSTEDYDFRDVKPIYREDEYTNTILLEKKSLTEIIKYLVGEKSIWEQKFANYKNDKNIDEDILIKEYYINNEELIYYSQLPLFRKSLKFVWYNYPPIINDKYYQINFSLKKHLNILRKLYFSISDLSIYLYDFIYSKYKPEIIFLFRIYKDIYTHNIPNIFEKKYDQVLNNISKMNRVEYDNYKEKSLLKELYLLEQKNRDEDNTYVSKYYVEQWITETLADNYKIPDYLDEDDTAQKRGYYFSRADTDEYFTSKAFQFHKSLFQLIKYDNIPLKEKIKKYQGADYFETFSQYYKAGLTLKEAYDKIEEERVALGLEKKYTSFESFKSSYYSRTKK